MIKDIILKREIKYWLDKSEYYKKVFSKFHPLIRLVDFASINIPEQEKSDFITGIAGIRFYRSHPKEIEKLLSPVMKHMVSIIKSHEYQKTALKERLKDKSYNKNGLNIPLESDIDKIIRFLPPKEILVTGLEKGADMAICDYVKYWNDLLSIPTVKPKKQPPPKEKLTFKNLFADPDNAQKVKDILEKKKYTKKGVWVARMEKDDKHKGTEWEFVAVYFALTQLGLLKDTNKTKLGRLFGKEFEKDIADRTSREIPNNDDVEKFKNLFSELN